MVIEPMINMQKIKYVILDKMIETGYIKIPKGTKNLNIFINLDSIFSLLYREDLLECIKRLDASERVILCAELANIPAHYRKYFWTRHNLKTTFYLYYMNKKPKYNMSLYEDYASYKIMKKSKDNVEFLPINKLISDNLKLFNILVPYIPKVYLLLSNGLDPAVPVYHVLKTKTDENDFNLILTKDEYDYQLINDRTNVMRLSYDKSQMINKNTLIPFLLKNNKYKPENNISGYFYENILPFISCKSRSVKAYKGSGKVAMIKKIDKNFDILTDDMSFNIFAKLLKYDLDDELYNRYKIMNVKSQYKRVSRIDKMNINESLVDKFENRTIMEINSEHFPYNPIELIELCYGINFYE